MEFSFSAIKSINHRFYHYSTNAPLEQSSPKTKIVNFVAKKDKGFSLQ